MWIYCLEQAVVCVLKRLGPGCWSRRLYETSGKDSTWGLSRCVVSQCEKMKINIHTLRHLLEMIARVWTCPEYYIYSWSRSPWLSENKDAWLACELLICCICFKHVNKQCIFCLFQHQLKHISLTSFLHLHNAITGILSVPFVHNAKTITNE